MNDFNDYVNQLNSLENQETKSELENFYFFNSSLFQFFKAIDNQVKLVLNSSNLNPKSVELIQSQVNEVLSTLNKLKFEISMLNSNKLSEEHRDNINKTITYIKEFMVIGEVEMISGQLIDLLKKNETTFSNEQEAQKRQEQADKERIDQEKVERKSQKEQERKKREKAERKVKSEKELKKRREEERKAKEEQNRKEREEEEEKEERKFLQEREEQIKQAKMRQTHVIYSDKLSPVNKLFGKFERDGKIGTYQISNNKIILKPQYVNVKYESHYAGKVTFRVENRKHFWYESKEYDEFA